MINPKVSIIIPVYNNESTIEETLNSIVSQTYTNYEVIICDDGSTDSTSKIIEEYAMDYSKFNYHKIKHCGNPGQVRNTAATYAKGKYIAFLDSDDVWYPEKLEKQVELFNKYPDAGLVFTDIMDYYNDFSSKNMFKSWVCKSNVIEKIANNPKIIITNDGKTYLFTSKLTAFVLCYGVISTCTAMLKKNVFFEMNGFDSSYIVGEDLDLWIRVLNKYNVGYIDKIMVKRRIRADNVTSNKKIFVIDILAVFYKNFPNKENFVYKREYK
ncbi:glycosyltransferase family 2 protein, partial [bacterium]|nr:glycosyltransferase family 2 protein [bacterium]